MIPTTKNPLDAQRDKPFHFVLIRLVAMAALATTTYFILRLAGISKDFPPLDTLYFPFVNIVCGAVIWRTFRRYGVSTWTYLGFEKRRLGKDIAWGLLWLFVTYIPMIITLMGSMYLIFGADMFQNFEQVFSKSSPQLPAGVLPAMSVFGAVIFLANAPIEEIIYRGWLQKGLVGCSGITTAILIQGVLFGLQHMMFAGDVRGMAIYGFMFTAWGITAGIIVHKQRRLAPMVITHWIVNIAFGVGPMLVLGFMEA